MALDVESVFALRVEYYSDGTEKYVGEATPGTLDGGSGWRIKLITYVNQQATKIEWASGTNIFDKVWNDRATYVYS